MTDDIKDSANEGRDAEEPVVRDKRRIDPDTGEVRSGVPGAAFSAPGSDSVLAAAEQILDQELGAIETELIEMRDRAARAEAELVNFRTRVERDRAANREAAIVDVIRAVLPAMDDLDRAEAHGDLAEGTPLALVAQKLWGSFERFGLVRVGEKGEAFDPALHEAMTQLQLPDATAPNVFEVLLPGYRIGERLVRAAKVVVAVPVETESSD